ncbi:MAG: DUF5011 domain-containing protein [Bacilli bacterium]|nr:DUF5011 domain-containing protein [Bacilli bacterium]
MKKTKRYLFILFLCCLFLPITKVSAASYVVTVVKSNGSEQDIGSYGDYDTARNAMMNYGSDANNVAVVKENGEIINAKYGIVHLAYNKNNPTGEGTGDNEHRLFPSESASTAHTVVHAAYGNDAAFLDYNNTYRRAKVKISGYTGWINRGYYTIVPISRLQGTSSWIASLDSSWVTELSSNTIKVASSTPINLRSGAGTNYAVVGAAYSGNTYTYTEKVKNGSYTWYKIGGSPIKTYYENYAQTGCLIHYYATYNSQGYSNLGKAPSFLNAGMQYYSFDGNYYYTSLTSMLDDYREGNSGRAVNASAPYYPYYLYLSNHSKTKYTANDFNQGIINKGFYSAAASKMYGQGEYFILSQERYGVNALLTFSAAINESATGTSAIAMQKNNLFGHNAYGTDPFANATTYATVADGILAHASMTGNGYNNPRDDRYYGGHYGNKQSGMNVKYATDPYWGEKAAQNAYITDNSFGLQEFNGNTIGVKQVTEAVPVRKNADENSGIIYYLKNNIENVGNMSIMVTDKVYGGGKEWYKVRTDAALNDNQDIADTTYSFDKSYGYIETSKLYVANKQPIIVASDRTINKGENIDLMSGVIATDPENGNITSSVSISGEVYINVPGEYKITYTATDSQQFSVSKTITVTVNGESIPTITASNKSVTQYTSFNPKDGVTAEDGIDGNITDKIEVITNTVNMDKVGTYKVIYKITNSTGKSVTKEISVTVKANEKPVITAKDQTIGLHSTFDPLKDVSASDTEDGNISNIEVIENTVNTNELGTYKVTYKVKDSANQEVTKTVAIKVVEKALEQKNGRFYLEYLKSEEGKLTIKGYHTIDGIDNDLKAGISYELVLVNQNNGKEETISLDALTDTNQMSMPISSPDGKNYKYAWFKSSINIDTIADGDYTVYIRSYTKKEYALSVVQNILFNEQATHYAGSKKDVTITNDYLDSSIPMNFIVRTEKIGTKESRPEDNQYSYIDKFELVNQKLHLKIASYSVGIDMRSGTNITRKVIFENINTFKKYTFDVGYTDQATFDIKLINPDAYGIKKERAWFDKELDITTLETGKYAIYITNQSNISDYAELNDLLFTDLSSGNGVINGKQYQFTLNEKLRNRIELLVK